MTMTKQYLTPHNIFEFIVFSLIGFVYYTQDPHAAFIFIAIIVPVFILRVILRKTRAEFTRRTVYLLKDRKKDAETIINVIRSMGQLRDMNQKYVREIEELRGYLDNEIVFPQTSIAPHIICPSCNKISYSQGDIDHEFCVVCGFHKDLTFNTTKI